MASGGAECRGRVLTPARTTATTQTRQWKELKDTFAALIDLPSAERETRLTALGGSDPELRRHLETLLEADARADSLLSRFELAPPSDPAVFAPPGGPPRAALDPAGLSGRTISHFRVLDVLGSGGMGVVYRAEDLRLGRTVALKFPLPQYALDPVARERFLQEARAASALDHPNVCTVYEAGESEEGHLFLAMACYAGETLKARLARSGALPVDEAADIARALLQALDAAHAAGVVHRDLKPGNVMLADDGAVKILDFGLARVHDLTLSGPGGRPGTTAYMSPEQLEGDAVGSRTDLWSLGVVLYEMLTGKRPFGGGHDLSTVYSILHDTPEPPSRIRSEVPATYDVIVERLLCKNPDDRYATAGAALAELGQGVPPLNAPRSHSRPPRWGTVRQLASALAVVAAIGGMSAAVKARLAPEGSAVGTQTSSIAVLPFVNTSGDTANEHVVDGLTDELISALSKVPGLRVSARTSVIHFKGRAVSLRGIADTLNVATVLEASARRAGDAIKLKARLVRASDDSILWAGDFSRRMTDVFSVRDEIARAVVAALNLRLERSVRTRIAGAPTRDPVAHELYWQGNYSMNIRDSMHLAAAATFFRRATERDPAFALAFAALADVYIAQSNLGFAPLPTVLPWADAAADRAIALDPSLGEAYASKGMVLTSRASFDSAEASFQRAIGLNDGTAWSHHYYSLLLTMERRTADALHENSRALLIDPFGPPANTLRGVLLFLGGDRDGARRTLRGAIDINPNYVVTSYYLGVIEAADGHYSEALPLLEQARAKGALFPGVRSALAYTYMRLGRTPDADAMLASLRDGGPGDRARIDRALGAAVMGDVDRAFAMLGHARWDIPMTHDLIVNPLLARFRADPRYSGLLAEMGLKSGRAAAAER